MRRARLFNGAIRFCALFLVVLAALLPKSAVLASTLTVTNLNDSGAGSLRQAIADAIDGDIVTFDPSLAGQTITLSSGELLLQHSVTITGLSNNSIAVSGNNVSRVFNITAGTISISNLTIENGLSPIVGGGGIYNAGNLTLNSILISNNTTTISNGPGAGIYNAGQLSMTNVTLSGNTLRQGRGGGAALYNASSATATIANSMFHANTILGSFNTGSVSGGGAIFNDGGSLTVTASLFSNNGSGTSAPVDNVNGGALLNGGTATITNSTFFGNGIDPGAPPASNWQGGAIANFSTLTVQDTTIDANTLTNCRTRCAGPGIYNGGTLYLYNSLVVNDTGGIADLEGAGAASGATYLTGPMSALGPLQDNGGPTWTIALLPGNPAINTGSQSYCAATDQRGVARPQSRLCDIGAYEYQFAAPTISASFSPNPAMIGNPTTLIFTIGNPNASTLLTGVGFSDTLPTTPGAMVIASPSGLTTNGCGTPTISADPGSGNITFSGGTIAGATCTVSVNITEPNLGTYNDVSSIVTANEINGTTTATASLTVTQSATDVSVVGSVPTTYSQGSPLTFTIIVTNGGPNAAPDVTVNDVWTPAQFTAAGMSWTCTTGPGATCPVSATDTTGNFTTGRFTLPANVSDTFTITGTVTANTTGPISTTATVASPVIADPTTPDVVTVISGKPEADLAVTNSVTSIYFPGNTLTYTIAVSNGGPNYANNITLSDMWTPAQFTGAGLGWTCVAANGATCPASPGADTSGHFMTGTFSLPVGGTVTFTLTGIVANGVTSAISNIATVSSPAISDPNTSNNTGTATSSPASADLSVSKSGPSSVNAGSNINYTIGVSNNGPDMAQNVSLSDPLPANTTFVSETQTAGPTFTCTNPNVGASGTIGCTISSLANGAPATFSVVLKVSNTTPNATTLTNTVSVTAPTSDSNTANNSASSSANVVAGADVVVTKTGPASAYPGANMTYTLSLTNNGPFSASNVDLIDNVPANTTFVSESQTAGPTFTCTKPVVGATGTIKCTISTLALGASATFSVVVKVNANVADGTTITNTATASSTTTDPNPANNSASASTTINSIANLSVTKSGPAKATQNSNVSYTLSVTNAGPNAAKNVLLSDAVPANMTFVSESQTAGPAFNCVKPVMGNTGTLNCTLALLNSGATATFTVVMKVNTPTPNTTVITNTATVSSTTADPNNADNTASVTTIVNPQADLAVTATGPATARPGAVITYTVTITNNGPDTAQSVTLTDNLPASNIGFVSETQTAGPAFSCAKPTTGGTGPVTCSTAALASGTTATFTIAVHVLPNAAANSVLTDSASATSATADPNSGNNSATVTTTVS